MPSVENITIEDNYTEACRAGKGRPKKDNKPAKAKVNVLNSVENVAPDTSATAGVSASGAVTAGPVAALNSVQQVKYTFDPERFSEASSYSGSFWSVNSSIPIQTQRIWNRSNMEEVIVKSANEARQPSVTTYSTMSLRCGGGRLLQVMWQRKFE